MMNKKTLLIAWREYWSRVSRISFWLSTLSFPVIFLVISLISGLGSASLEDLDSIDLDNIEETIIVRDDSQFIELSTELPAEIVFDDAIEIETAKQQVIDGDIGAFIYYPTDVIESKTIQIYTQDTGFIGNEKYNDFAKDLIKNSAIEQIADADLLVALNNNFATQVTAFKDGEPVVFNLFNIIAPIVSLIAYMILVMTGSQFMLQSVAEEKENRIIEVVLSTLKPHELILGKLIGLSGVVLTQVIALGGFSFVVLLAVGALAALAFPIPLGAIGLEATPIILGLVAIVIGFLTMSALMIGVAAVMPNYRDAQSFSGLFIFLSITPAIFFAMILAQPSGIIAQVLTYVPLAGNLTMALRSALGSISGLEIFLGITVNLVYMVICIVLAFKLFEIGALQYKDRLQVKQVLEIFFKR